MRLQAKRLAQQHHQQSSNDAPVASPIDLRVSKGVGSRGYDVARISVISQGAAAATAAAVDLRRLDPDAYNDTFQYRWRGAFDLGTAATSCGPAAVYNRTTGVDGPGGYDADCMEACTRDYPLCEFYTCVCALMTSDSDDETVVGCLALVPRFRRRHCCRRRCCIRCPLPPPLSLLLRCRSGARPRRQPNKTIRGWPSISL